MTADPTPGVVSTLLEVIAALPPEQLVEGAQVHVIDSKGREWTVTLGPRMEPTP